MSVKVTCNINEVIHELEVEPTELLVDTLRNRLGLTGTKKGCGTGDCGACTVIMEKEAVRSCIVLTASVHGKSIITIEGLEKNGKLDPIQQAFVNNGAVQCGFCTPGMVLTTKALLDKYEVITTGELKEELSGNLCRCTGYTKIFEAIKTLRYFPEKD